MKTKNFSTKKSKRGKMLHSEKYERQQVKLETNELSARINNAWQQPKRLEQDDGSVAVELID